jgi:hypothetical protein
MPDDAPDPTIVGPGGLDFYAAQPQRSSLEVEPIGAPRNEVERQILAQALLGKGGRLAVADATRKIMAAREAAPAAAAQPAVPDTGRAEIAADLQRQLDAAATRHGALTEAERERAVASGEAHLRRTLFGGSDAMFAEATAAIEKFGHKVDGAMLANPMAFQRAWLTARGGA